MERTKMELLKAELKAMAAVIKAKKIETKELQRSGKYAGDLQYKLLQLSRDFRYKHIAYCLLRGTPYERIESKVREGNEPNQERIRKLVDEYSQATEDVCAGS